MYPKFPEFEPIRLEDREIFNEFFSRYQPDTSELTFTNLFIWRSFFGIEWSLYKNWLLIICTENPRSIYALPPIGPPSRLWVIRTLFKWMKEEAGVRVPRIERADELLISEIQDQREFMIEPTRNHFDYVYLTDELVKLPGKRYMRKRQQTNRFKNSYSFEYVPLENAHMERCIELTGQWCDLKRCDEELNLMGEKEAVLEALNNYQTLELCGGAIMIDGVIEAFALGEMLNNKTAVIHVEKANQEIRGIYQIINQQFCENQWKYIPYMNREQDLGVEGLRQAKQSYQPYKLIEKFRIRMNKT